VEAQPEIGQTYSDLPGDVVVVGVLCEKLPGNKGRLTIDFETPYETTYEVEWVEVDKALITNPRYWDGSTPALTPAGPMPLTLQDKAQIEKWEQEENPLYKMNFLYKVADDGTNPGTGTAAPITSPLTITNPLTMTSAVFNSPITIAGISYNLYELSTNAQDYAAKRLHGEEVYRIYAPVVRETSESLDDPDSTSCGLIQSPPDEANAPSGYTWQKSADRTTRTGPYGKYRRQREWQGAEQIDADIYGTADPSVAEPVDDY
jgi:hypothetical protein